MALHSEEFQIEQRTLPAMPLPLTAEEYDVYREELQQSWAAISQHLQNLTYELKQAREAREEALRERRQMAMQYTDLFNALPFGLVRLNHDESIIAMNARAEELLGRRRNEAWRAVLGSVCEQQHQLAGQRDEHIQLHNRARLKLHYVDIAAGLETVCILEEADAPVVESRHQGMNEPAMSQWLAQWAHQLRSPLTAMQIDADQLVSSLPEETGTVFGDRLQDRLDEMNQLLEGLMMMSDGENIEREALSIRNLFRVFSLRAMQRYGDRVELNMIAPQHCVVFAHSDLLMSALDNLLDNAVQASDSVANLEISARPGLAGGVEIDVIDDGPGVPGTGINQLFKQRLQSRGNGLGLLMVQHIAAAHGGSVEYLPIEGGSCFRLYIPACSMTTASPAVSEVAEQ